MDFAIEVFVRGHSAGKSRTFPYEASRVGPLWVMRDAPRRNPRDYRKEEWIAHDVAPGRVDALARRHTRGRFFVCVMIAHGEPDEPTRAVSWASSYPGTCARGSASALPRTQQMRCCMPPPSGPPGSSSTLAPAAFATAN